MIGELLKLYGGIDEDPELVPVAESPIEPVLPEPLPLVEVLRVDCPGWPFDSTEAQRRQAAAGEVTTRTIELDDGVQMQLTLIPAGEFVTGNTPGYR